MADTGFISADAAARPARAGAGRARRWTPRRPHFVDYLTQELQDETQTIATGAVDVYTTLDLHLQRLAQDAVRDGLVRVDAMLAKRKPRRPQAALIAIDPRTGEILAMVGGRSYNQSQFNRAVSAKRQPGSVFKPFVFLAAFERAAADGRTDITPATRRHRRADDVHLQRPAVDAGNYDNEYDGPITLRRALAHSRNIATVKVAESAGFDNVAALWRKFGIGTPPRRYPSIALGVFEATPFEIATAYTVFPNGGTIRPLRAHRAHRRAPARTCRSTGRLEEVARKDTTFLVTNMMRSVLNEGTAAGARGNGFTLDAAGKTGTTNDLRDAWFVGFTPELLTVVWVGLDDNQAARPERRAGGAPDLDAVHGARPGRPRQPGRSTSPTGIVFVDIDKDTGKLAGPAARRSFRESFLAGTEPTRLCLVHGS